MPAPGRGLFLRAEAHPALAYGETAARWKEALIAVQSFKPAFDRLQAAGFDALPAMPDDRDFDVALVRITKHKQETLGLLAQAYAALAPGGRLHVAGAKDEGIESIEKRLKSVLGPVSSVSKYHARAVTIEKQGGPMPDELAAWADAALPRAHVERFVTAPGMFSFDKVDKGSRLLVEHLPKDIKGRVADFGAGWGYLSSAMLGACPYMRRLDLYEAEAMALDCARHNVASNREDLEITFNWADVTAGGMPAKRYDFIVMNPPFHSDKAQQASLGQEFIKAAAKALKPGGRLIMVANLMLPYDRTIAAEFDLHRTLVQADGFKVIEARR
ncbi:MAG: class I SAM-dependent methyltransferase [Beijerinckiaceae bacterium]|nr:class I SAM-dependent methyltransferase [Beijerinckiaceae bacterium]